MVREGDVSHFALSILERRLACPKGRIDTRIGCGWDGRTFEARPLAESMDVGCGQSGPCVVGR